MSISTDKYGKWLPRWSSSNSSSHTRDESTASQICQQIQHRYHELFSDFEMQMLANIEA